MQSHEESSSSLCENPASDYGLHEMRFIHKTRDPRWRHFIIVCADSTRALIFFPDNDGLLKLHDPAPAIILDLSMLNVSLSLSHADIMRLKLGGKEEKVFRCASHATPVQLFWRALSLHASNTCCNRCDTLVRICTPSAQWKWAMN